MDDSLNLALISQAFPTCKVNKVLVHLPIDFICLSQQEKKKKSSVCFENPILLKLLQIYGTLRVKYHETVTMSDVLPVSSAADQRLVLHRMNNKASYQR